MIRRRTQLLSLDTRVIGRLRGQDRRVISLAAAANLRGEACGARPQFQLFRRCWWVKGRHGGWGLVVGEKCGHSQRMRRFQDSEVLMSVLASRTSEDK